MVYPAWNLSTIENGESTILCFSRFAIALLWIYCLFMVIMIASLDFCLSSFIRLVWSDCLWILVWSAVYFVVLIWSDLWLIWILYWVPKSGISINFLSFLLNNWIKVVPSVTIELKERYLILLLIWHQSLSIDYDFARFEDYSSDFWSFLSPCELIHSRWCLIVFSGGMR